MTRQVYKAILWPFRANDSIRYDAIEEFNVDWKAERDLLNLAHATKNKKNVKTKTNASANLVRHRFRIHENNPFSSYRNENKRLLGQFGVLWTTFRLFLPNDELSRSIGSILKLSSVEGRRNCSCWSLQFKGYKLWNSEKERYKEQTITFQNDLVPEWHVHLDSIRLWNII